MSSTTVAEFASELKKTNETLLEQLKAAGVAKSTPTDTLTEADKQNLLSYLQASHGNAGAERKKITLVKKSTTEIKQADSTGKARTIQVEVRKKRTFVRREDGPEAPVDPTESAQELAAAAALETAELARREEEASRQAELIRRQEEELAESRRLREEQEAKSRAAAEQAAKIAAEAAEEAAKKLAEKAKSAAAIASKTNEQVPATPAAAEVASVTDAVAAKAEAVVKAKVVAAEKSAAESIARAEEAARAADLGDRRRKAEAEAAAIRLMMSSPAKKAPPVKKPEELRAEAAKAAGLKGTLHKPVTAPKQAAPAAGTPASPAAGAGK